MRRAAWGAAALGLALAASAGAAPQLVSRRVELRQEAAFFTEGLDAQKLRTWLEAQADLELRPKLDLRVQARAWYDLRYDVDADYRAATGGSGSARAEVREAALRLSRASFDLALGPQIVAWGKADRLRVLDVVNPLDLREFVLEELSESKRPLFMLNARRYFGGATLQALVLPDHRPQRLAPAGSDFYDGFHDPRRAEELPLDEPRAFKPADAGLGLQLSGTLGRTDLSLNFLSAYDAQWVLDWGPRLTPLGPTLAPARRFHRVQTFGASFARPLGSLLARGELVYARGRRFARALPDVLADPAGGGHLRSGNLGLLLAADRSWKSTFASVQVALDRVSRGRPADRERHEFVSTLLCWRDFSNATWRAQMLAIWQMSEGAWIFQPRLVHQQTSALSTAVGFDLVAGGARRGLWGQFRGTSRALATVKYEF